MTYSCCIVDDEPIAIEIIESYLKKVDHFEVLSTFQDPLAAFQALRKQPVDLLFLDIQMPELSGLEFLQALQNPPEVILTTAHREYALEGFELNVLDYLLKPIAFPRFLQSLDKFLDKRSSREASSPPTVDHIFVRADRKSVRIDLDQVLYVEGLKDYVKIFTTAGTIVTKSWIGAMEEKLSQGRFLRIHRSYIVARDKITAFTATDVEIGDRELPIGRSFKSRFFQVIGKSE